MPSSLTTGPRPVPGDPTPIGPQRNAKRVAAEMAVGALCGGGGVILGARLIRTTNAASWDGAEIASLCIAVMLVVLGAVMMGIARSTQSYQAAVCRRDPTAELPDAQEASLVRFQGLLLAVTGPILIAPVLAVQFGLDIGARTIVGGVILVLLLGHSWLNWRIYQRADEMMRQVVLTSCAVSFGVGQLALFIWASLAKMGLVADVDSWTLLTVLIAGYLIISGWVSVRRGLT